MARKKKSSKDAESEVEQTPADEQIEGPVDDQAQGEAEEVEATADDPAPDVTEPADASPDEDTGSDDPGGGETPADDTEDAEAPVPEAEPADEPEAEVETVAQSDDLSTPPAPMPDPVVVKQGGFFPLVLGGLVAASIGFGLARFGLPDTGVDAGAVADIQRQLDSQSGAVSKLTERIETLEAGGDLGGLEAAQSDNEAAISGLADRLAGLESGLSDLESRLTDIENRPTEDGASGAALAAYERELKELKSTVAAMTENATLLEKNAQAAAQATLQRAALTRILTALDAGTSFDSAVADLEGLGVAVPEALSRVSATGVPSLTSLQESFPDAARAALEASRDEIGGTDGGGLTSFLRSQLGARSLQPREGNDPDAVLSRVEAATRDGRLTDALAEIEALPEAGRAELSDWSSLVTLRQNAVAAAQELGAKLN